MLPLETDSNKSFKKAEINPSQQVLTDPEGSMQACTPTGRQPSTCRAAQGSSQALLVPSSSLTTLLQWQSRQDGPCLWISCSCSYTAGHLPHSLGKTHIFLSEINLPPPKKTLSEGYADLFMHYTGCEYRRWGWMRMYSTSAGRGPMPHTERNWTSCFAFTAGNSEHTGPQDCLLYIHTPCTSH